MKQQQGIALITILVMVALATILAATIAKRQANTAENTAYLMRQNQSLLYAKSAEAFFSELLVDDAENAGDIDHLQENWAKPMPAFPVEDGFVSGTLQDESGKFNLNSLVNNDGTPNPQAKICRCYRLKAHRYNLQKCLICLLQLFLLHRDRRLQSLMRLPAF